MTFELAEPCKIRYRDSLHAAIVAGLAAMGLASEAIIGQSAAPWTFATGGRALRGGLMVLRSVTVSTSEPAMADALGKLDPSKIFWRSSNGDFIDLAGATRSDQPSPVALGQGELAVAFASPFLVSEKTPDGKKGAYARSIARVDLGAAFSHGLSRRLGRAVSLGVEPDRLSAKLDGDTPMLLRVRKSGPRDIVFPCFAPLVTLRGSDRDLDDAYMAGLGEKTRYGFGCPVALA